MELANVAFHIENTSKRGILGRRWRKCNMKEKLENLHNENRGKRVILWKFLNDGQTHKGLNNTDLEESGNRAGDCESMPYESYSLNGYESRTTLNQAYLFEYGISCDSFSRSDSSSALSDWLRPGLIREAGDGMETPKIPRCIAKRGARKRLQTRVTGTDELLHLDDNRRNEYSNLELEYSCTLRLFAEPKEPRTTSTRRRDVNETVITKSTFTNSKHECSSNTEVNNKDCFNVETSQHIQCNVFNLKKERLRHNGKNKLKQLLKLYKARKLNKKQRSTDIGKSKRNGNALNTDGCNRLGSCKLASTSGPSRIVIHKDMCQTKCHTEGLVNRGGCCVPDRDTVYQDCDFTEKDDTVSKTLVDFYDCECLDLAMDCYCSENDEFAYLNNGFVMD